jgi:Domain of unknown function (DUF4263)
MDDQDPKMTLMLRQAEIRVEPGKPLQIVEATDDLSALLPRPTSTDHAVGRTIAAYTKEARKLLDGRYASQKELAPVHLREKNNITVLHCNDGIIVRYDPCSDDKGQLIGGKLEAPLSTAAPLISEQLIHFPDDPKTYVPAPGGLEFSLTVTDGKTGNTTTPLKIRQLLYGTTILPSGFEMPSPPARPPCFASVYCEADFHIQGVLQPPAGPTAAAPEQFITHSRFRLPVGWRAIEIYPLLGEEYWKPEYAAMWAELDLLGAIAQRNAVTSNLKSLDGRGAARKRYAKLFEEFETLLAGPEEPAHQFLKQHPEILCPTHDRMWSKLGFGDRKSDFVFREPHDDYLLVEIEAPVRQIFRQDGQQREELTHAINQIVDWLQYISDNKQGVEQDLGLQGISTNPRTLVVIGRSASLTADNRRKLETLQAQQNKLRILTYDDVLAAARANLERILGPLGFGGQNIDFYFYNQ